MGQERRGGVLHILLSLAKKNMYDKVNIRSRYLQSAGPVCVELVVVRSI